MQMTLAGPEFATREQMHHQTTSTSSSYYQIQVGRSAAGIRWLVSLFQVYDAQAKAARIAARRWYNLTYG